MIRKNVAVPGGLTLSLKMADGIQHHDIACNDNRYSIIPGLPDFASIQELLQYHQVCILFFSCRQKKLLLNFQILLLPWPPMKFCSIQKEAGRMALALGVPLSHRITSPRTDSDCLEVSAIPHSCLSRLAIHTLPFALAY